MGHPNEDLIRQGYDAFGRGDMDTLRALFDPDIVWHAPGRSQLAGDHQGVDAVLGYSSTRARSGWTVRCPAPMGAVADRRRLRHECEQLKLALAEATVQLRIWQKGSEFVVASQERCKRLGCRLHGDVRRRL
jgi:hypothetical protein